MIRYLEILGISSSILVRRSSILMLALTVTFNTILILVISKMPIAAIYTLTSSIAISLLLVSELRSSIQDLSRALYYYGGSRRDRLAITLYLSIIASTPSYCSVPLLGNPYILLITFIITTVVISRIVSYHIV